MQHDQRRRFVWVHSLRASTPEKWPADAPAGVTASKIVLAERRLTPTEAALPLSDLALRYPLTATA